MSIEPALPARDTRTDRPWLDERQREFEALRAHCLRWETRWSWSRLLTFITVVLPWVVLVRSPLWALVASLLGLVLFVYAVVLHLAAQARREAADRLILVTGEALQRCGGTVTCVRGCERPSDNVEFDGPLPRLFETGETWPLSVQERDDLDAFAPPVGIFGLLNRTSTAAGARRLRDQLDHPLLEADRIAARQNMVRWLAEHGSARLHLLAALAALRTEDARTARLVHAIAGLAPLALRVPHWLFAAWSVLCVALVAFVLTRTGLSGSIQAACVVGVFLINGLILRRLKLRGRLEPWQELSWAIRGCLTVARQAECDLPAETGLAALRTCLARVARPGVLPRLRRRAAWSETGGLVHWLLNNLLLFDVHVVRAVESCVLPHRDDLLRAMSAIAELDALCSLGAWSAEQPVASFPIPQAQTGLTILGGVHPLVSPNRVVANDVRLSPEERVWVITGSNMAGKSTLLRMIGVNVLLAQIGAAVTAREMRWSPLRLITDLRTRDNLAQEESYFLAEVRHLRRMVHPPAGTTPILGLMDEPFRGTNSQEQSAASVAVLHHLIASPHLFLLATHDAHLTILPEGAPARNWHFRENLSPEALVFDCRLYPGPAQTRNALRILEREGYPAELVARAYGWLKEPAD